MAVFVLCLVDAGFRVFGVCYGGWLSVSWFVVFVSERECGRQIVFGFALCAVCNPVGFQAAFLFVALLVRCSPFADASGVSSLVLLVCRFCPLPLLRPPPPRCGV